jgi:L-ascorbate metabolism protein UlaG (beta-lactamase superfamily)
MATAFTYYGGMAVKIIRSDGFKIWLDPYLSQNPFIDGMPADAYDVDLVLVTHAAFDHFGDTADILKNSNAVLVAGTEIHRMIKKVADIEDKRMLSTIYGDEKHFDITTVRTVLAQHISATNVEGVTATFPPFGYSVQVEPGGCYYHAGDTFLYSDMRLLRELYKPTVMTVGISRIEPQFPCEMNAREAAYATSWIGPDVVIPTHYATASKDKEVFAAHMRTLAPSVMICDKINAPFSYQPYTVNYK